jgi:hypothetical protein
VTEISGGAHYDELTKDINLWDEPIRHHELREIVAMLVDMAGCKIVRGVDTGILWIAPKYGTSPTPDTVKEDEP